MNVSDARQETDSQAARDEAPGFTPGPPPTAAQPSLVRPLHDRMLAGVGAGIADYLGVDPTVVRIVLAVLVFVGGAGIPIYLAGWLLIPEEGAERSIASDLIGSLQSRSS
jgi:phage shock protein PspC (stress-responsive transcriptional regulator)